LNIIDANRQHIEAALEYSGGTHLFEDVKEAILDGRMQLWPYGNSCAVTEIVEYARKKVIHVFLAGGQMDEVVGGIESVAEWGRQQGCQSMTMSGRKGWERILDKSGFRPVMVVMEKEL
jgi:hypothetical protein